MPLNEELLSKFTQNERGDLYFEDKLIVRKDITNPEPVSNVQVSNITFNSVTVTFNPSPSTDVAYYEVSYTEPAGSPIETVKVTSAEPVEFTGLKENHDYEIYIVVVDTGDNKTERWYASFNTLSSSPKSTPNLDHASIEPRINEENQLYFLFNNFELTDSIDVYINEEFKQTVVVREGYLPNYFYGSTSEGQVITLKAVAKNNEGEAELSITTRF